MTDELALSLRARNPITTIESFEWERVQGCIAGVCRKEDLDYLKWNQEEGLQRYDMERKALDPNHERLAEVPGDDLANIVSWFRDEYEYPAVLHLEDYHHFFHQEGHENAIERPVGQHPQWGSMWFWRNAARLKPRDDKCFIISGPSFESTSDLQKEVTSLRLDLPDVNDLGSVFDRQCRYHKFNQEGVEDFDRLRILEAARGMSVMEASAAFSQAGFANDNRLDTNSIPTIIAHKRSILRNSGGLLEYSEPDVDMCDVGGLENLKSWLGERRDSLSPDARDFGIEPPKGLLLMGVPGCGKSLAAKAIASLWEYPLVRFDISRVFGGIVGSSEGNMRRALDVAEAVAPCILWIDEIEKGMAGAGGSGNLDSGVTARTMGILLTWLQEKKTPVFVVATMNKMTVPPESIRKGRFDEIFFVDLPNQTVRREIFKMKIDRLGSKSGSDSNDIDLDTLASETHLFSGAEIEQSVKDALYRAFQDGRRPICTEDLLLVVARTSPLAITLGTEILEIRKFCRGRAQHADGMEISADMKDIPVPEPSIFDKEE